MKTQINNIKISHRGLWNKEYPENSIGAFKRSIENNLPIELDVHLLKDGNLVVFHDDNLKRMTGLDKNIKECTIEDVQNLRLLNSEYTIPTFSEVLELVNGRVLLVIEIKTDVSSFEICSKLAQILDTYEGMFWVKSFNPLFVAWFRFFRPKFIRGLLVSSLKKVKKNILVKITCYKMCLNFLCKPDFIAFDYRDLPNKKVERLYKKGIPILLWTIRDQEVSYKYNGIIFEENSM